VIHRKNKAFYFTSPVFTKVLQQTYDLNYLFRKVKVGVMGSLKPAWTRPPRPATTAAAEQIIQCVEDRVYCALLGPRLSGKTVLLNYIESNLARLLGWTCVYIDLQDCAPPPNRHFCRPDPPDRPAPGRTDRD
jgi:hypothetical protein